MLYLIHGQDEYGRAQEVARLREQTMQAGLGELNVTRLDGRKVVMRELLNECSTLPFLTDRRLLVVEGLLKRLTRTGDELTQLLDYLPGLPPTTDLALVEEERLPARHPLLALSKTLPAAKIILCEPIDLRSPDGRTRLQRWLAEHGEALGVRLAPAAVTLLIEQVGADRRALDQELQKLAARAGYAGEVSTEMVHELTPASIEANIFALVDALGQRRPRQALDELERLLGDGANELYILTMIARQVRLLIGAQELSRDGLPHGAIGERLRVRHRFALDKLLAQAPRFAPDELDDIMERIAQTDEEIKTGKMDPPLALELLTLRICQRSASIRQ